MIEMSSVWQANEEFAPGFSPSVKSRGVRTWSGEGHLPHLAVIRHAVRDHDGILPSLLTAVALRLSGRQEDVWIQWRSCGPAMETVAAK